MPTVNRVKRPWIKERPKAEPGQGRANPNRHIYGSERWKQLSRRFREQNPLCVTCKSAGRLTPSKVTDHHVPINSGADPWDESNWVALCMRCHNIKSSKERHG